MHNSGRLILNALGIPGELLVFSPSFDTGFIHQCKNAAGARAAVTATAAMGWVNPSAMMR